MPASSSLNRLFADAVSGKPLPEAESIAWIVASEPLHADTLNLMVIGSGYWLDPSRRTSSYASSAVAGPVRR